MPERRAQYSEHRRSGGSSRRPLLEGEIAPAEVYSLSRTAIGPSTDSKHRAEGLSAVP